MPIFRTLLLAGLVFVQLGCLVGPAPQPEPVKPPPERHTEPPPAPVPEQLPTLRDAQGAWLLKIMSVRCDAFVVKLAQPAADQVQTIAQGLRRSLEEQLAGSARFALVESRAPLLLQVMVLEYKQTGVADQLGYSVTVTGTIYDAETSDIRCLAKGVGLASRESDADARLRPLAEERATAALVRALEDSSAQLGP